MTGSWRTNIVGWVLIASGALALGADIISKQGIPDTLLEWVIFGTMFATGIGNLLAKDAKVSNAPNPVESHPVP